MICRLRRQAAQSANSLRNLVIRTDKQIAQLDSKTKQKTVEDEQGKKTISQPG